MWVENAFASQNKIEIRAFYYSQEKLQGFYHHSLGRDKLLIPGAAKVLILYFLLTCLICITFHLDF